jgi:hypothetical protein
MRFGIVSDPAKIARIQKRLADRDQQLMTSRGSLVRYEMPALPNAFPQLSRILDSSAHRAQFFGIHYHIHSKDRKLERLLPAAEYYQFVFRAVPTGAMRSSSGSAALANSSAGSSGITTASEYPRSGPSSLPSGWWIRSTR